MATAPVLNETDIYREFAPPAALRGTIACLWIRRGDGNPVLVLPDTCTDIIWRLGDEPLIAGPDTRAWPTPTRPGMTLSAPGCSPAPAARPSACP